jgi:DNA-binding protein HU-beta
VAMTRSEFFKELASDCDMSKQTVQDVFQAVEQLIIRKLAKVGRIPLGGFATVVLSDRKARMGRNPATGEAIKIKAKRVVKLRPARVLKEAFNKTAK